MNYVGAGKYSFYINPREIELTSDEIETLIEHFVTYDLIQEITKQEICIELQEELGELEEKIEELEENLLEKNKELKILKYTEDEIDIEIIKKRKILEELNISINTFKKKRPYNKRTKIIKMVNDIKKKKDDITLTEIFNLVANKLNITLKAVNKAYYSKK